MGERASAATGAAETGREAIVFAAAACFMQGGFDATSIDDVAHRLNATKGRIYHYYRSKADLFFDVHRRGMAMNLQAIEPLADGDAPPLERFAGMCRAHLRLMMDYIEFQRVVMQGVEMHLAGPTTPAQRRMLALLMEERERYEGLFRKVLVEGRREGVFAFPTPSFASKAVLAILNNPVLWYRRRQADVDGGRDAIVEEFAAYALNCVAAG